MRDDSWECLETFGSDKAGLAGLLKKCMANHGATVFFGTTFQLRQLRLVLLRLTDPQAFILKYVS